MAHRENPRLAELRIVISDRIRSVCAKMPQAEFDALVARMAEVEYKYEMYALEPDLDARRARPASGDRGEVDAV